MKRLTLKEMTESEQLEVQTQLNKARKNLDRPLTNSEQNKIKDETIDQIMAVREKVAKTVRARKRANKAVPSSTTFNWSESVNLRRPR